MVKCVEILGNLILTYVVKVMKTTVFLNPHLVLQSKSIVCFSMRKMNVMNVTIGTNVPSCSDDLIWKNFPISSCNQRLGKYVSEKFSINWGNMFKVVYLCVIRIPFWSILFHSGSTSLIGWVSHKL